MNTSKKEIPKTVTVEVPAEMATWRLDRFLSHEIDGWSRKDIGELISRGAVRVRNRERLVPKSGVAVEVKSSHRPVGQKDGEKGTRKLHSGAIISIDMSIFKELDEVRRKREGVADFGWTGAVSAVVPQDIPLDIVYEDDDLLVVDKPAGMVIHPAYKHMDMTLANALAGYFKRTGIPIIRRIGLVNRLDKDVSGLVVVAKHAQSLSELSKQFSSDGISHDHIDQSHKAWKYYRACVEEKRAGSLARSPLRNGERALIEGWIKRTLHDRRKFVFTRYQKQNPEASGSRYAASWMTLISNKSGKAEIEVQLITGRTHQIRAQLASLGLPIIGDSVYGTDGGYMKLRCIKVMLIKQSLKKRSDNIGKGSPFRSPVKDSNESSRMSVTRDVSWGTVEERARRWADVIGSNSP